MCRKGRLSIAVLFTVSFVTLISCGTPEKNNTSYSNSSADDAVQAFIHTTPFDYLNDPWVAYNANEIKETDNAWDISEYHEIDKPLDPYVFVGDTKGICQGDYVYVLSQLNGVKEKDMVLSYRLSVLNTLDNSLFETEYPVFSRDIPEDKKELAEVIVSGIPSGSIRVASVDCDGSRIMATFVKYDVHGYQSELFALFSDLAGNVYDITSLTEAVWNSKYEKEGKRGWLDAFWGLEDTICILDKSNCIAVMVGKSGNMIYRTNLEDCNPDSISYHGRLVEKTPFFSYKTKSGTCVNACFSSDEIKETLKNQTEFRGCSVADEYGNTVFIDPSNQIISWNVADGNAISIHKLMRLNHADLLGMSMSSRGELVLLFNDSNAPFIYKLREASLLERTEVNLYVQSPFVPQYIKDCAKDYMRRHPNVKLVLSNGDSVFAESNILAEKIRQNEGPDIIIMQRKLLEAMREAKLIKELDEIIDDETKQQIFPGVLQAGIIDGKLYGVPFEASISVLLTNKNNLDADGWDFKEFKQKYENAMKAGTLKRPESLSYTLSPRQLLYDFCLQSIERSGFVDYDAGTCRFDSEEFIEVLSFCKKYGEKESSDKYLTREEMVSEVRNGEAFSLPCAGGLIIYSNYRAALGEDYCPALIPFYGTPSVVATCYDTIAVNVKSNKTEIISDFLNFLLSVEAQGKYSTDWIRKDVIEDRVINGENGEAMFLKEGNGVISLAARPDGTSFADEYVKLMENAVTVSWQDEISAIVFEESDAFFAGGKTVEEVTQIIQDRVSIYLSERN